MTEKAANCRAAESRLGVAPVITRDRARVDDNRGATSVSSSTFRFLRCALEGPLTRFNKRQSTKRRALFFQNWALEVYLSAKWAGVDAAL